MTTVTLLYFDGCPHWQTADARLQALADELDLTIVHQQVDTPEDAEQLGLRGSPTILIEGTDPFAEGDEPAGLSCRRFQTPDGPAGSPTEAQLRAALT